MRASRTLVTGGSVLAALLLVSACSSGGGSTTATTTRRTGPTSTTRPDVTGVQVNLTLTGDRTAAIQGTKGECTIPAFGAPTYEFSGKDYPSLGPTGSLTITGPVVVNGTVGVPASAKVLLADVGLTSPTDGSGISLTNNDMTVMVNTQVGGGTGESADNNLDNPSNTVHAQLTGSIRCSSNSRA